MTTTSHGEDGFTLVELLVSLALLALMMAYALQAFSTLRQMNRIAAHSASQDEVDSARRYLREEIGDVRVLFEAQDDGSQTLVFDGKPDSLRYIASSDGSRETGGLYQVRLYRNGQSELIAERQLMQTIPVGPLIPVILLREVNSLHLAYAAGTESGGEMTWQESWPPGRSLPSAVRIEIGFKPGDQRRWPETLVLVRAAR